MCPDGHLLEANKPFIKCVVSLYLQGMHPGQCKMVYGESPRLLLKAAEIHSSVPIPKTFHAGRQLSKAPLLKLLTNHKLERYFVGIPNDYFLNFEENKNRRKF